MSRGLLLLLLSFAEHKVISSKSSTHSMMVSGIFRQRFDIIQSVNIGFLYSVLFTTEKNKKVNTNYRSTRTARSTKGKNDEAFDIELPCFKN